METKQENFEFSDQFSESGEHSLDYLSDFTVLNDILVSSWTC